MAASTTTNYGWTEIDPDKDIDIAGDVNTPLEQIDASLKTVADKTNLVGRFGINVVKSSNNTTYIGISNPAFNLGSGSNIAWNESGQTKTLGTTTSSELFPHSHLEGHAYNLSQAYYSHVEGGGGTQGSNTSNIATGNSAHVEGYINNRASGDGAHAEGYGGTRASSKGSHSEGYYTKAAGDYSHAEGSYSQANGSSAHAEGTYCVANGNYSHAEGDHTTASGSHQHVCGIANIENSSYLEIVGNGKYNSSTSTYDRSNARTLSADGTSWTAGDVTCDAVQDDHTSLYSLRAIGSIVQSIPSMEYGTSNSVTVSANSHTVVDVTFGSTKTEAPVVFSSIQCPTAGVNLIATVQSVTNAQASIVVTNLGTTDVSDVTVDWLALSGR